MSNLLLCTGFSIFNAGILFRTCCLLHFRTLCRLPFRTSCLLPYRTLCLHPFRTSNPILTCLSTPPAYPPAIGFSTPLSFLGVITLSENLKHHSLIYQQIKNPVFCMPKKQSTNKLCTNLGYLLPLLFAIKVVKQNPNLVPKLI